MMQSLSPFDLLGLVGVQGGDIHIDKSYYKYNMNQTTIKLVYNYSEARLLLQSLSP